MAIIVLICTAKMSRYSKENYFNANLDFHSPVARKKIMPINQSGERKLNIDSLIYRENIF